MDIGPVLSVGFSFFMSVLVVCGVKGGSSAGGGGGAGFGLSV